MGDVGHRIGALAFGTIRQASATSLSAISVWSIGAALKFPVELIKYQSDDLIKRFEIRSTPAPGLQKMSCSSRCCRSDCTSLFLADYFAWWKWPRSLWQMPCRATNWTRSGCIGPWLGFLARSRRRRIEGATKRRPPLTFEGRNALDEISGTFWKISSAIEALKAVTSSASEVALVGHRVSSAPYRAAENAAPHHRARRAI